MNRVPNPKKEISFKKSGKALFLIYPFTVFLLSILPINGSTSSLNHIYLIHIRLDYLGHAALFLPWVPLVVWMGIFGQKRTFFWILANTIISGVLLGTLTEGIQYFLSYRSFNINDLIANILGVLLGIPMVYFLSCFKKPEKPTPEI